MLSTRKPVTITSIIEQMEAGLVLEGWEVKSLRTKSIQLKESYVLIRGMQAWLLEPTQSISDNFYPQSS